MIAGKLRKSVLQLAVQGRLVPQDPADEPAAVLLERIRKKRARLLRKGEIKKDPRWNSLTELEALPQGWAWCRLGELCRKIGSGSTPRGGKSVYSSSGIPFLRSQNITDEGISLKHVAYISEDIHAKMAATEVHGGDILLNITGASLGRCALVDDDFAAANVSQHVTIIRLLEPGLRFYIHKLLLSPQLQEMIWARQVGVAREGLSRGTLQQFEIPLPPLAEQKRIVSAVNRLLPKISDYEKTEAKIHQVTVSFAPALERSVLQAAVEGKLVPQDPADEPASVLLEKIRANKRALIKKGKIKKPKIESYIFKRDGSWFEKHGKLEQCIDQQIPYELPKSWVWERIGNLFRLQAGKFISAHEISGFQTDNSYPCFGGNGIRGYVSVYNNEGEYTIIGRQGALCGNINIAKNKFYATEHAIVVYPFYKTDVHWIKFFLLALNLNQYATSTAQPGLSVSRILNVLFPVPPLKEQKNIALKITTIYRTNDKMKDLLQ